MSGDGGNSRLNDQLREMGLEPLDQETEIRLNTYLSLFVRWNERVSLSSFRDEEEIIKWHLIESIIVARQLPDGVASLLDYGSGGGLPGIPIALCRPEIAVTLAESQGRKAAFLQEAVRVLNLSTQVWATRAEMLRVVFGCVILRAVDRMPEAVKKAGQLVAQKGWLALMTTDADAELLKAKAGTDFCWEQSVRLTGSESRLLALGKKILSL